MSITLITEFHEKINSLRIGAISELNKDIYTLLDKIINDITISYPSFRENFPVLLSSIEYNGDVGFFIIKTFFDSYLNSFFEFSDYTNTDNSLFDNIISDETLLKFGSFTAEVCKTNKYFRLSEINVDLSVFDSSEIKEISTLIISKINIDGANTVWTPELIESNYQLIIILHPLLRSINELELFYHVYSSFSNRIGTSRFLQQGRDIIEEAIITSFKDGLSYMGFFIAFKYYSNNKNFNAAYLYGIILFSLLHRFTYSLSSKIAISTFLQCMILYRNSDFIDDALIVYNRFPSILTLATHDRHFKEHLYFLCLIKNKHDSVPNLIFDYLNKERESLIQGGQYEALPWLVILYNIKRIYLNADFSISSLGYYVSLFESMSPASLAKHYKDLNDSKSTAIKENLLNELAKLSYTRNLTDFLYDIEYPLTISNRLIEYSAEHEDYSSFLLAMVLKSDYSLLFNPISSPDFVIFELPHIEDANKTTIYDNLDELNTLLGLQSNTVLAIIAIVERKVFSLNSYNNIYSIHTHNNFDYTQYASLLNTDFFSNLLFHDSTIDDSGVYFFSEQDFVDFSNDIIENISIFNLFIPSPTDSIYIVKDINLSFYPHNLFIDNDANFIGLKAPITNILSVEWFLTLENTFVLDSSFTKSIWNPLESGDYTLLLLNSKIESVIEANSFVIHNALLPTSPLDSVLNIVVAHGDSDIADKQLLFYNDAFQQDLNKIFGTGEVLIFIVCHSGSMQSSFFKNNTSSLVKTAISKGYKSVIAPAWALHVSVVEIWLPEFLLHFNAGVQIDQAVFYSNKKVFEKFPTPAAWACFHLFGSPFIRVSSKSNKQNCK